VVSFLGYDPDYRRFIPFAVGNQYIGYSRMLCSLGFLKIYFGVPPGPEQVVY